jgi:thioredoxin 1
MKSKTMGDKMAKNVMSIKEAEFDNLVKKTKGLTMVDFWASWCAPCQMTAPALEAVAEKMKDRIKVYKVDIDDNHKLASDLGVMSIPTMIIFKDGNEQDRIVGALGESEITKRIESYLG